MSAVSVLAISSLFLTLSAVAQQARNSIAEVIKNPVLGKEVILRGRILNKDREAGEHTDYILSDGVDRVVIELQDKNLKFSPNETYEIVGIVGMESDEEHQGYSGEKRIEIVVRDLKKIANQ